MGSFSLGIVLLFIGTTLAKDVFRYVDEETGQSHYMTGDPGQSVEGGWTFTNADGSFELVYKADKMGFQPEAAHLPIPVEDTNEVTEAKTNFYTLFEEAKAKAAEAADEVEEAPLLDVRAGGQDEVGVVDVRRKREAYGVFRPRFGFKPHHVDEDATYNFDPSYGFVPVDAKEGDEMKDMEDKLYTFVPFKGFVSAEEAAKEEMEDKPIFKYVPFKGFVPAKDEEEDTTLYHFNPFYGYVPAEGMQEKKPVFKFKPYYGFVPVGKDGEEKEMEEKSENEENEEFKYVPFYGFVPKATAEEIEAKRKEWQEKRQNQQKEWQKKHKEAVKKYEMKQKEAMEKHEMKRKEWEEKRKEMENKEYKFVPYKGFVPADEEEEGEEMMEKLTPYQMMMAEKRFKYSPYFGFVPVLKKDMKEEPAEEASARKKRDADMMEKTEKSEDLTLLAPHNPALNYNFHPFLGFVPQATVDEKDATEKLYKYVPYYGFVPIEEEKESDEEASVESDEEDEEVTKYKFDPLYGFVQADQEIKSVEEQEYKYDALYGFVPVTGKEEEDVKTYKFNPFYGFVEKKDEDSDEEIDLKDQKYKFVPFYGFVPIDKKEDDDSEETSEEKSDEEEHHVQYVFHPYYGYLPTLAKKQEKVEEKIYKYDPLVGFYPVEEEDEASKEEINEDEPDAEDLDAKRKKRDAQFLYQPVYHPVYLPVQQIQRTPEVITENKQFVPQVLPVVSSPLFANQVLFQPAAIQPLVQKSAVALPENEFPVIPHDPENEKQGALEF